MADRRAHNPEAAGSTPAPATTLRRPASRDNHDIQGRNARTVRSAQEVIPLQGEFQPPHARMRALGDVEIALLERVRSRQGGVLRGLHVDHITSLCAVAIDHPAVNGDPLLAGNGEGPVHDHAIACAHLFWFNAPVVVVSDRGGGRVRSEENEQHPQDDNARQQVERWIPGELHLGLIL